MACGKPNRTIANPSGFSLIEVLIALVVLVFALYGVLDLVASTQRLAFRAQRRAAAVELARAKIAEIQAAGFNSVTALWAKSPGGPSQPFVYPPTLAEFPAPYDAKPFRWQARFDPVPEHPEVVNMVVRVFWHPPAPRAAGAEVEGSVAVAGLLVRK